VGAADRLTWLYFTCAVAFLVLWLLAFWRVPQVRRELVFLGLVSLPNAIPLEVLLWVRDWWSPPSIFGTHPGYPSLEDFLYAFFNNSLMAALYSILLYAFFGGRQVAVAAPPSWPSRVAPFVAATLLPFPLTNGLGLHSSWASLVGTLAGIAYILWRRPDLGAMSIGSGAAGLLVGLLSFALLTPMFPGFVDRFWITERLSNVRIMGGPLEDLVWYLSTAAWLGIYYKFWYGVRLEVWSLKSSRSARASWRSGVSSPSVNQP
jgi:hypothetical protein